MQRKILFNVWVKAARQAPSYLSLLRNAYREEKHNNIDLYHKPQYKSRNILIRDSKKIIEDLLTVEIISLYRKHSFLFREPITPENAISQIMQSESALKDLYIKTLDAINMVSSISFRSPDYLAEKIQSLESALSSGSLTSLFRRKNAFSQQQPALNQDVYSIVEMRDYLGLQVKNFIETLNEFSFLSCLRELERERFDKWILLKAMLTSELDAILFNLGCDIKFNQSLVSEYNNQSYLGKMFSHSLYSLHRRQQKPSDVIAIKSAAYHKIRELLDDMNDPDPNKSLNPVKIFSKIQMILGFIQQEPHAVKVLDSIKCRLECLAKEMVNLPLTPYSKITDIKRRQVV